MAKKKQHHPSADFVKQVSKSTIGPELSQQLTQQVQAMAQQLQRNFSASLADLYLKQAVLTDLALGKWKISKDKWAQMLTDKEDEGLGYEESKKPAAKGDLIRASLSVKADPKGDFGPAQKISLASLANQYTLLKEVEDEIVGMKKGQTKTISADLSSQKSTEEKLRDGEDAKKLVDFKVTIDRISSKKEAPSAQQS